MSSEFPEPGMPDRIVTFCVQERRRPLIYDAHLQRFYESRPPVTGAIECKCGAYPPIAKATPSQARP